MIYFANGSIMTISDRKKFRNSNKLLETTQNALIGITITAEDLANLRRLSQKCRSEITYEELNYSFSFYIPHMVESVYQYNVKIEPRKSPCLRRIIFSEFVSNNFPYFHIAFDGVQTAYAPQRLETGNLQCKTKIIHPESKKEREFIVTITEENDSEIPIKHF